MESKPSGEPMKKYRTGHDAPETVADKPITPGKIQPGRFGIYKGEFLVGQCGPKGTAATARRFGVMDAKFTKDAWRGK
jgi:hypothetical protein